MTNEQTRSSTWKTISREGEELQRGRAQAAKAKVESSTGEAVEPQPFPIRKRKPRGCEYTRRVLLSMAVKVETGCWEWALGRDAWGYGVTYFNQRAEKTHRVAWSLYNGEIPAGLLVCHKCDNPPCINPNHLFLGTSRDNALDASRKGRLVGKKGSSNPTAKLTERDVKEIRASTKPSSALAKIYGVVKSRIVSIRAGIGWNHVQ